ncbi:DUF1102 family protein [Halalkaliarchaeum sp. AArc-CO]|uniref:hypothetical protein n=1 Tax=Halalkaliarchaeum sp. AArc-CO TaxID=2866381 RepID=UPI00217E397F|nr:hypothetical protein [Halalkaliarchaeum sp. AArc-CO]UWG51843.1 DUF1102 family protein [Halalkaliarchaeum sp. AArc-CO]
MERRKFVIGLGSLAAGGAAAMGSGAFSSVEAERDLVVEAAGDAGGLLGIEPADTPNGDAYAEVDDGIVSIDLTTTSGVAGAPDGVNDQAFTVIDDILTITNQGSQEIVVGVGLEDSDGNLVSDQAQVGVGGPILRLDEGGPGFADRDDLDPGNSVPFGLFFNFGTPNADLETVLDELETIRFVAEEADD